MTAPIQTPTPTSSPVSKPKVDYIPSNLSDPEKLKLLDEQYKTFLEKKYVFGREILMVLPEPIPDPTRKKKV
jgi:hypothetical protein